MFCLEFVYVATTFFLARMFTDVRSEECRDIYSTRGMMLKGHIIMTMSTSSSLQCLWACNDNARCQSFNYVMMQNICELNSLAKEASPKDFLPSPNRYYITVKDVDECIQGTHDCLADVATCTNTFGFYSCACIPGYDGDGKTSCEIVAPECNDYQTLTEANRKVTSNSGANICDRPFGPGWFRFEGDAGTKMPTTCSPKYHCDTHAPGWLNGEHPTLNEGAVTRQVCFHWSSSCCYWSTNIQVRNCGSYFVYYLRDTPACRLRYCGSD